MGEILVEVHCQMPLQAIICFVTCFLTKEYTMEIQVRTLQVTLLESNSNGQVTVVEMTGDIDGKTAPDVQTQVLPLAQSGVKLLLDMTQVLYMSSAGLRMLLSVYRQVNAKEGQVVLIGLTEDIRDTMSITGFLDFFTTCETLDAGLATLNVQALALSS
jgi:anti-sigma B factor antagonist